MAGAPAPKVAQAAKSSSPKEVLVSPVFWLALHHVCHGLGVGPDGHAQIAPIAGDFKVGDQIVFWAPPR